MIRPKCTKKKKKTIIMQIKLKEKRKLISFIVKSKVYIMLLLLRVLSSQSPTSPQRKLEVHLTPILSL